MDVLKNKKLIYIFIGIITIIICVIICVFIELNDNKNSNNYFPEDSIVNNENIENFGTKEKTENNIIVHVAGEVNNPGLVEMKEGSRIKDVVEKAGGFTNEADIDKVNLAYEVQDEQKIVIPNINDQSDDVSIIDENTDFIKSDSNNKKGKININTATQSELESLTGIGPSMASKIIEYRKENGKFKSVEDIKNVSGIGSTKYESIKDEISIN
ncbi:MAG: helix-hairpin-helix domain-containing protein [Clostridia bacterium]|nr:helix-hairpin-helix domain-containing protein [Clostridia bacterium]